MKEKIKYPEYWEMWSPMRKIGWIQQTYGKYNDEKDCMEGFIDGTPEEIAKLYDELWDIVEPLQAQGYDVN